MSKNYSSKSMSTPATVLLAVGALAAALIFSKQLPGDDSGGFGGTSGGPDDSNDKDDSKDDIISTVSKIFNNDEEFDIEPKKARAVNTAITSNVREFVPAPITKSGVNLTNIMGAKISTPSILNKSKKSSRLPHTRDVSNVYKPGTVGPFPYKKDVSAQRYAGYKPSIGFGGSW